MASDSDGLTVVIQVPSGPCNRYTLDAGAGAPRFVGADLDVPPSAANVGIVPGTSGADGQPVAVLVIHDPPLCRDARVDARLLGGLVVGTEAACSFFAVAAPAGAGLSTAIQGVDDLSPEARARLAALPQREDGPGARVTWVSRDEAIRRIREARKAGRTARIGSPPARPARPLADRFFAPEAALLTELDLARLPYRFRRYLEQLVLPGERVLGAAYDLRRPPQGLGRLFARPVTEGILVVTDRQVCFLRDVVPIDQTLIAWGYVARVAPIERVARVSVEREAATTRLCLAVAAKGGEERIGLSFPREATSDLERAAEAIRRFVDGVRDAVPRRAYARLVETSFAEGDVPTDQLGKSPRDCAALPGLGAGLLASAETQAADNSGDGLAALYPDALSLLDPAPTTGEWRERRILIAEISSFELRYSHLGSWLEVHAPGRAPEDVRIPFGVPSERSFARIALLLGQLLGRPLLAG